MRSGEAVEEIVAHAQANAVDRIVIADHRKTQLRPVIRTVPESVARKASRPVTVY